MRRRKLINTHNTKQKYRFRQHQETPKITDRVQYSIEKYKSTIFSRDLSKKIEEDLKRYDKDHISCHEMMGWTHDQWPISNFEHHRSKVSWSIFLREIKKLLIQSEEKYELKWLKGLM